MRGSADIKIKKPVEEVWRFISDMGNNSHWLDGVSGIESTCEGEVAKGATFTSNYRFDGKNHKVSYLLTEFEPPRRFAFRISGGPHPSLNELELIANGDSTKVKHLLELDINPSNLGAVTMGLGPMVRLSIMFRLRKDLKKLKKQLEGS